MNINEKRAEVLRLQRASGKKISRLRRNNGVELVGTGLDPRVSRDKVSRYNGKQLDALIGRLSSFNSRSTQYVGDSHGRPIPANKYQAYRREVNKYNRSVGKRNARFDDVFLKSAGQTVKERRAMRTPVHRSATNPAVNVPTAITVSKPNHITSEKALDRLIASMRKRNAPEYQSQQIKAARKQLKKMAELVNAPEILNRVADLTDTQFEFLWNNTNFANAMSLYYETQRAMLGGKEAPWHSSVIRDQISDALVQIEDAKKIK